MNIQVSPWGSFPAGNEMKPKLLGGDSSRKPGHAKFGSSHKLSRANPNEDGASFFLSSPRAGFRKPDAAAVAARRHLLRRIRDLVNLICLGGFVDQDLVCRGKGMLFRIEL